MTLRDGDTLVLNPRRTSRRGGTWWSIYTDALEDVTRDVASLLGYPTTTDGALLLAPKGVNPREALERALSITLKERRL